MKRRNFIVMAEAVLALACLGIQVGICRLAWTGRDAESTLHPAPAIVEPPALIRENAPAPRQLPRPVLTIDRKTHRLDRQLLGQRRLLSRLLTKEDFLNWSGQCLEVMAAYKRSTNELPKCRMKFIDTDQPDWQEQLAEAMELRQSGFNEANQTLDLLARENYSNLDDEAFDFFAEYFEATSQWVNCMYDDQASPAERASALRHYEEVAADFRDQVWLGKRPNPLVTSFKANHGDIIGQYQMTSMMMQLDDLWNYGLIHGTNEYRFRKFDPELKAYRQYRVLLDED